MTVHRSMADVEGLLRRTYAEVADRTTFTVAAPGQVRLAASGHAERPLARRVLASAAAMALIVAGVIVLVGRGGDRPAGIDTPTRVVPGWVPQVEVPAGSRDFRTLAVTEIHSDDRADRVTYGADVGSISVELDRAARSLPDGEPAEVRGEPARRTASTLSWFGPDEAVVTVSWTGDIDEATVTSFVHGLLYVDDDIWHELTGAGGFRHSSSSGPLAAIRIDADRPFDVELEGDLHEGTRLWVRESAYHTVAEGLCQIAVHEETTVRDSRVTGYLVIARGDVTSAVVRPFGADERSIELTSLRPLADVSFGGVVFGDRAVSNPLPMVDCEGAS